MTSLKTNEFGDMKEALAAARKVRCLRCGKAVKYQAYLGKHLLLCVERPAGHRGLEVVG